jgi:hypothetical protein
LVDQKQISCELAEGARGGSPPSWGGISLEEGVPDALIAEPGFFALGRIEKTGRGALLCDAGVSQNAMVEDVRRLGLSDLDCPDRADQQTKAQARSPSYRYE